MDVAHPMLLKEKFIGCIFASRKMQWTCNKRLMHLHEVEEWLRTHNDDPARNQTTIMPCQYDMDLIKSAIIRLHLDRMIKRTYTNE